MNIPYLSTVFSLLFLFGAAFNWTVAELERRKVEGYTWVYVVVGVAVTLVGAAFLVGWLNALLVGGCMAASGLPMMVGAARRHQEIVKAYLARLEKLAGVGKNDANLP